MEFRNRERMPLTLWLGINLLAAILGLLATLRLVLRVWNFLANLYPIPQSDVSLFPDSELRLFFIVGFSVAGVLIGLVIGLVQWWLLRRSYPLLSHRILLNAATWLLGLPLSYAIFAIAHDFWGFSGSFLSNSMSYMLVVLFLIYFIGGVLARIGEWLILQIIDIYFTVHE